jgi:protein-tyrosine phosphatase
MIDVHNHLLPGLDDGSRDMAETLAMCKVAAQDGIKVIVATPHCSDAPPRSFPQEVDTVVAKVNERISARGLPLRIVPGMEVRISPHLPEPRKVRTCRISPRLRSGRL